MINQRAEKNMDQSVILWGSTKFKYNLIHHSYPLSQKFLGSFPPSLFLLQKAIY